VLAVAGLVLALAGCSGGGDRDTSAASSPSASSASPSDASGTSGSGLPAEVTVADAGGSTIGAEPFADFMVAAGARIWVSGVDPGVVAYDAATGEIVRRVAFDSDVIQAMARDSGAVYAAGAAPDVLLAIDAESGRVLSRTALGAEPLEESSVAAHDGTAWVLVDPDAPRFLVVEHGAVTRTVPAPDGALAARYGFDSLWVTVAGAQVARLDPKDGRVRATYDVGVGARFLAVGEDAVWTLDASAGTVSGVDPRTGQVQQVQVSDREIRGGDIAADLGVVWARTTGGVTRVDPVTLVATDRIEITPGSGSVAAAADWLWLSDHDHEAVHRVPVGVAERMSQPTSSTKVSAASSRQTAAPT